MKAVVQQQLNSMESSDSTAGANEYAYRPLTTKHRRAGSTGTTGDEEYTTDEDEIYADEADCAAVAIHASHPVLKSDLVRAATELFGYHKNEQANEPTSLFDDDDGKFHRDRFSKVSAVTSKYKDQLANLNSPEVIEKNGTDNVKEGICEDFHDSLCTEVGKRNAIVASEYGISKDTAKHDPAERTKRTDSQTAAADICQPSRPAKAPSSPTTLHWEKAVAEAKEHAITKLQEELKKAHEELKLKDKEVTQLSRFRQDVETELEELTASLFQEAHNMVREANTRQATAERLLEESRMKTEVLAAEVVALKTLVLTSTPAQPNPHLHPQIDTRCRSSGSDDGQVGLFARKHRRSPSHFNLKYGRENSPPESPTKEQRTSLPSELQIHEHDLDADRGAKEQRDKDRDREIRDLGVEVDPRIHSEFLRWKCSPCVNKSDPFVARVFHEDIDLCLDFPNKILGSKVQQAVLDGIIFIEAISDKSKLAFPKKCALLEVPRQCHYQMRLGDQDNQWYSISQLCRNRIISVCEFLNYLRYVERGLVKSSVHDIYWEVTRLRKEMVLARLGLALSS